MSDGGLSDRAESDGGESDAPTSDAPKGGAQPRRGGVKKPKKKRGILFRIARGLGFFVLGVVLLLIGAVLFITTETGEEFLRPRVAKALEGRFEGGVDIAELEIELLGKIELRGVAIHGKEGRSVEAPIQIGTLRLTPAWGDLGGPVIPIEEIAISDVSVHVIKYEDGTSNLTGVYKSKPISKQIEIRSLALSNVDVRIDNPDGSSTVVEDAGLRGRVHLHPPPPGSALAISNKTVAVDLEPLELSLRLEKPTGLKVGVDHLKTGAKVELVDGAGTLTVRPVSADIALELPTLGKRAFPFAWEGVQLDLEQGNVDVSLGKLALDAVSLTSANVHAALKDGALDGAPRGELLGLHVDATKLNQFLGRDVLRSDVDVVTRVADVSGAPRVDVVVTSGKAKVELGARLDAKDPESPAHDVTVKIANVDTTELLADPEKKVPPIQIGSLALSAKGTGRSADALDTNATLEIGDVRVRGVPIDGVKAKVRAKGNLIEIESVDVGALGQAVAVSGTFDRSTKEIDARVKVHGDVGVLLAGLANAGVELSTKLPEGAVKLREDDLEIGVRGKVGGDLHVRAEATELSALGSKVRLFADVDLRKGNVDAGEKSIVLRHGDVNLEVLGLRLSSVLALRGRTLPKKLGLDALINLRASAHGTRSAPEVDLRADVTTVRADKGRTLRADLLATVDARDANLTLRAEDTKTHEAILTVAAAIPILLGETERKLDDTRPFDVRVSLPRRSLTDLATFVAPEALEDRKLPDAEVELALRANGSFANPSGSVLLDARGPFLEPARRDVMTSLRLDGNLVPGPRTSADFTGTLAVSIDDAKKKPDVRADLSAHLPYSVAQGGLDALTYDAKLAIGPIDLGALPELEKLARVRGVGGTVEGTVHVAGNRRDVSAEVDLTGAGLLRRFASKDQPGPLGLSLSAGLTETGTTVGLSTTLNGTPLTKLDGKVGVAGKGLLLRLKDGLDPTVDATLTVEERSLASLATFSPKLAELPGVLGGTVRVHGTAKAPLADADVGVSRVPMWSQRDGAARVKLTADAETIRAGVTYGAAAEGAEGPLAIRAELSRKDLLAFSAKGTPVLVTATIAGDAIDLKDLVPRLASDKLPVDPKGTLRSNLSAKVELEKVDGATVVKSSALDGSLDLTGNVPIPGSKRVVHDLALQLTASGDDVTLAALSAKESDAEVKDRSLLLSGKVSLPKLKPTIAELRLKADRWLLFGTKTLGMADAPRGTLTADLGVTADLAGDARKVTVEVDKLEALFPDRFDKAHQPEDVHAGDLLELASGATVGKLPVPDSVKAKAKEREAAASPTGVAAAAPPSKDTEISVVVKPGARVFQSPIDFTTEGRLDIAIRGGVRTMRGKLQMTKGELSLGGAMHPLTSGSLTFDEQHPSGWIDLTFEKKLDPWALRGISEASAGDSVKIQMTGPISDRKTVLSGAGPGALYDLLAMHNEGRERFVTGPDMPASVTVDFPQHQGLLVLSFISVNLPHLLFLDRVSGWADPLDAVRAYGRIENYEGERYFADGDARFKATMRPAGVGRSEAEVEVDYLFTNDPRLLVGVGGAAGSRGGGGPGFVLEWSSSD